MRNHARFMTSALAAGCAVLIAACGSSGSGKAGGGSSQSASLVRYSECMRSHGVSNFPDPSTTQGPNAFGIDGYNFNLPTNLNTQAPAYKSANNSCFKLTSGGGSGGRLSNPSFLAKIKQQALAHARCMRANGVPNFPDPNVRSNGQGVSVGSNSRGINPQSPAFQHAQRVCQRS